MNMFARFNENPAMTLQDIKETKRYGRTDAQTDGRTDGRTDKVKTVYPLQTKFAGGITTILQSDENNYFDIIYFQTSETKQMFAKFPGIIFMDNTYNVCSEGYILNAILVEDQDSSGKPVAYSFMRRETKECLEKIIDIFCEQNDTSKANDIMVDKDLTEINLLEEKIPHAHIQICSFHVLKYFKSKVAKLKIKQDEKSKLIQLLREILYSHDEEKYEERHNRLCEEFECFIQYYDDNWQMGKMFSTKCKKNYGHFTNNKVESHNEKINSICHEICISLKL